MPTMTRAGYTPPRQELPKAPPPKPPKKKKSKKKKRMNAAAVVSLFIFALAAAVGAGTLYVYAGIQPYEQAFVPGTILMGYPLAGATRAEADRLLDTIEAEHVDTWQAELVCMDETYTLTAKDIRLAIDRESTLEELWAAGHEGGMLTRYLSMRRLAREAMAQPYPVLTCDLTAAHELLARICAEHEQGAVSAAVEFSPGSAEPFAFTDEQEGTVVEISGIAERLKQAAMQLKPERLTLTTAVIAPALYRAELEEAICLRSRVVAKVTGDGATRQNVRLAAGKLNGARMEGKETLSFNMLVGARTAESGYQTAPEPAYGEDISGVGGGICQVSTALHRAALLACLDVQERHAAPRPVDYCDMGQEAVVSGQGLDLVIANPTDMPLFMTARVYEEQGECYLELALIGEALESRYRLNSLIDETAAPQEPVYVRDREGKYATYTDERVPVGKAQSGYAVSVERAALDENGLETAAEVVSESRYNAAAPTIYVGMQEREEE